MVERQKIVGFGVPKQPQKEVDTPNDTEVGNEVGGAAAA